MTEKATSRTKIKSYEVQGQKYIFPECKESSSSFDVSGFVDQWPAYASKRMAPENHILLNRDRSLLVASERDIKLPNLVPKPKFLEYLETYIDNKLKKHDLESIEPNPMRLDIYKEAFDYLIEAFKTYKPLFAKIKREYDSMISFLREEIRNLEPLKEMIWTISEERNQEVLQIKQLEKEEITILKNEKLELMRKIGEMEADLKTLEIQIETLRCKLEEEHLAYRNEADARRLLIIDINDIKQQMDDISNMKRNQQVESSDDPVIIKLALDQAKKAHSELLFEITRMKTDYADVIPKRDFEKVLNDFNNLSLSSSENAQKSAELETEHQLLEEKFTALHQQRDYYYSKYMELSKSSTPRPDWKRCGSILSGGPQWWQEQSKDKSSKDLVDLLLQEINLSASIKEQVEGKGMDNSVPPFLRASGKINLRYMPKRDVKIHIREIWEGRKKIKEEQNAAFVQNKDYLLPPFEDYIDLFFKKTYGIEQIRQEWAYSFYDFISKEKNDEKIILFSQILNGNMDEEVYWDEMIYLNGLKEALQSKAMENPQLISKDDMKSVIHSLGFFELTDEKVDSLMETIEKELLMISSDDDKYFQFENLFMTNDEGEYGSFLNEIKKMYYQDKRKYVKEIEKELKELGSKINAKQLRDSIQLVDPEITEDILNKYIAWCFDSKLSTDLSKVDPISLDILVTRLNMGTLKRFGQRI